MFQEVFLEPISLKLNFEFIYIMWRSFYVCMCCDAYKVFIWFFLILLCCVHHSPCADWSWHLSHHPASSSPESPGRIPPPRPKDKGKQPAKIMQKKKKRQQSDDAGGSVLDIQQGSVMADTRREAHSRYTSFNAVIDFRGVSCKYWRLLR